MEFFSDTRYWLYGRQHNYLCRENTKNEKILVTIPEAVSLTGISRSFLYKRLSDGSIRSVVAGRRRLVNASSTLV
jgi:excisionase family DNA binding protein